MIRLTDVLLTDGLSNAIRSEPWAKAIAYALNKQLKKVIQKADECMVYAGVNDLPNLQLDALAMELRTPQYSESFDRRVREELVKNTAELFAKAGTKKSVLDLSRIIFGDAEISEWWEDNYIGIQEDGYFSIITHNTNVDGNNIKEFKRAASSIKRMSVWLEKVKLELPIGEINISGLELVNLPRIYMRTAIPFWSCRLWDGTWLLDGSYFLDSQYQPFPAGLIVKGIHAKVQEYIESAPTSFRTEIASKIEADLPRVKLQSEVSFWGHRFFDGTWYFDGSILLDSAYPPYPAGLIVGNVQAKHTEQFNNIEVEMRHNLWYWDGEYALDGSMVMDADIWKEAM